MPSSSSSWRHEGRRCGGSQGCRRHAALDGDTELARTTPIININKLVLWWTESWSSQDDTTDVYLIKTESATRSP